MRVIPTDWRTIRLCEPEQARLLRWTLLAGIPVLFVTLTFALALHALLLSVLLMLAYAVALTTLTLRLFSSVKMTLARLDFEHDGATDARRAKGGAKDRGEQIEQAFLLVDNFRGQHRRLFSSLTIVLVSTVISVAGWAVISLWDRGVPPASPATLTDGRSVTQTFDVSGLAASAARGGTGMLDTGIVLRGNIPVGFRATGTMTCVSTYSWCTVGPAGDSSFETTRAEAFPLPAAPAWGLIAQVGTGPIQFIGSGATVTGSGRLFLGVNDNYPKDNLGSFSVTVTFSCSLVTLTPMAAEGDPCSKGP
jgi:hypothetical protein